MAIVDAATQHYHDFRSRPELEPIFAAAQNIIQTISKSGSRFVDHDKFLYWVGKPSHELHGIDTDWDDVTQNALILTFLQQECEISPLITDLESHDTTGKPIQYQDIFNGTPWALQSMKWISPTRLAFQLLPMSFEYTPLPYEYDHVEQYWFGYGETHPPKKGFADIQAWQNWMLT